MASDSEPDGTVSAELSDHPEIGSEQTSDDSLETDSSDLPAQGPGFAARLGRLARRSVSRTPAMGSWLRPRLARLAVAVVAGLLMYASFPSLSWWWAAIVAIALLTWVLTHPATTPAGGLGYGFLFGMAFYAPLLPWISTLVGDMPWLVLTTVCACMPGLFGLWAVVVRRLPGWPIWFAVLWGAQEWVKSNFPFGGFPWGSIAFGQADGPLLPLVQLGGVPLLSTAVALIGTSVAAIAAQIVQWFRTGATTNGSKASAVAAEPPAVMLPGVSICLVLLAAIVVWPQVRHAGVGSGGEPAITVAVVQGNVPRLGLEFNAQRRAVLDNHVSQTLRLAEDVRAGLAPQPRFVIWPENSSDIDPFVNPDARQEISQAADAIGAPILIGTLQAVPGSTMDKPEYTNSMIVWNPGSGPAERHDKAIVQPFGEYLPMRWLFRHLSGYADRAGYFIPVPGSGIVHISGIPVGVATCWEVVFDRAARNSVLHGAQLLTVPSNNATFTKTMSEQQLAFAKVRAVEHDRYVVVAGTTGISAVIAPDGAELKRTDFFVPDYLDTQVRLKTRLTPATRWGPILQWVLVGAAGAVVVFAIRHNSSFSGWFRRLRRRSGAADQPDDSDTPSAETENVNAANESAVAHVETADGAPSDEGERTYIGRNEGAT